MSKKAFRGGGRIHRLLGGGKMRAFPQSRYNDLQIAHGPRQPIDAGDHQRLAGMDEVEDGLQFGAVFETGATLLLPAHHAAARGRQRRNLGVEVLIHCRRASIAILAPELFILTVPAT